MVKLGLGDILQIIIPQVNWLPSNVFNYSRNNVKGNQPIGKSIKMRTQRLFSNNLHFYLTWMFLQPAETRAFISALINFESTLPKIFWLP